MECSVAWRLGGDFPATDRQLISRAGDLQPDLRRAGLEEFARRYWNPVFSYLRAAWSKSHEDACDSTQAFFLWLLESPALGRYDSGKARFRAYLKSLVRHFVQHESEKATRIKRGGGIRVLSLERHRRDREVPRAPSPEAAFDRAWGESLLQTAIDRVRARLSRGKRALHFVLFEQYDLCDPAERPTYGELAARMGLDESDVRNRLFAVRERIRLEARNLSRGSAEDWAFLFGAGKR